MTNLPVLPCLVATVAITGGCVSGYESRSAPATLPAAAADTAARPGNVHHVHAVNSELGAAKRDLRQTDGTLNDSGAVAVARHKAYMAQKAAARSDDRLPTPDPDAVKTPTDLTEDCAALAEANCSRQDAAMTGYDRQTLPLPSSSE